MTKLPPDLEKLRFKTAKQKAEELFGWETVMTIEQMVKQHSLDENNTDDILSVIINLKEAVDTYYDSLQRGYNKKIIKIASFEQAKQTILEAGKMFEESDDLFEVLTCDIPLLRTVSSLYAKLSQEEE